MEIPVYLFTGFLESGKSTLIQETLADPEFTEDEKTLLILCEDGEVEFDDAVLADYRCDIVRVDHEADFSSDQLAAWQKEYRPDRVMIEFNGTWSVKRFWRWNRRLAGFWFKSLQLWMPARLNHISATCVP